MGIVPLRSVAVSPLRKKVLGTIIGSSQIVPDTNLPGELRNENGGQNEFSRGARCEKSTMPPVLVRHGNVYGGISL